MKKIALGVGILLIVALASVWVYLLFFNTNNGNSDIFALFGFGDTTDTSVPLETTGYDVNPNDTSVVDVIDAEPLRQLTTRPVIGYREMQQPNSNDMVYFVEAGTGHVYSINLASGEEERLSNITIPTSQQAAVSKDGRYVVIKSGYGLKSEMTLITLPNESSTLDSKKLPETSDNFAISDENLLLYTIENGDRTLGRLYDPEQGNLRSIFEVPFRESVVNWGETADSNHYVYPKPSSGLPGYLYVAKNDTIRRLSPSGYGFSALMLNEYGVYSKISGGEYSSYLYDNVTGGSVTLDEAFIPDKCHFVKADDFVRGICASSQYQINNKMPDSWYNGETSFSDSLWIIDITASIYTVDLLTSLFDESGREIDATDLSFNKDSNKVLFKNKGDGTLWIYDVTVPSLVE